MAGGSAAGGHGLRNYVIRRLLLMVPTLLGVTMLVFALCQFVPGGPVDQMRMALAGAGGGGGETGGGSGGRSSYANITENQLETFKAYYGFDKPVHVRYFAYMKNLATLNLGDSFRYSEPVWEMIKRRLPVSLYYGLITTVLTYLICIPLGIVKAIGHRTYLDNATSVLIFLGYAVPGFALGAVLLSLLAVKHQYFPLGGFRSSGFDDLSTWGKAKDLAWHSVLPLTCYLIGSFAVMTMLMKNSLMENMSADYVKTALANGHTWPRAILGHAVRNSLIPLATGFGHNISLLLTGSLLIERVFSIPGLGLLSYEAIVARDYPVVMGIVVIGALLMMVGNLLSDLCVAAVDPRVRFS